MSLLARLTRSVLLLSTLIIPAVATANDELIQEATVRAGAIRMHYLRLGSGETTVLLVHGWPESSHAWRKVMRLLATRYTVIAPDLRGVGGSDAPAGGYDKATMGEDLHALVRVLKPKRLIVVGHDIGALVTYAYVRAHANEVAGAALLDAPVPGTPTWAEIEKSEVAWHFGFNLQKPLAEQLVSGRQAVFFGYVIEHLALHPSAIDGADLAVYAAAYGTGPHLDAGFGFYRTFEDDKALNASQVRPFTVPLLLVGAEKGLALMEPALKKELEGWGATTVSVVTIPDSGHWVAEEQPATTARVLMSFVDRIAK